MKGKNDLTVHVDHELDIEAWFDAAAEEVLVRAKQRTPVRTGHLRDSLTLNKTPGSYEFGSDSEYFPHIEFGTVHIEPFAMVRTSIDEFEAILDQKRQELIKK